jgi:hypothetical protein
MTVIGITGHRVLPQHTEQLVTAALCALVARYADDELVGVSALAEGADTLFARAVLDAGGSLVAIVPARSYRSALPAAHRPVFDTLLARAEEVIALDREDSTGTAYMDAGLRMLHEIDLLVAVWDGQAARGLGGTAQLVDAAKQLHLPVRVIWPAGAVR